MSTPSLFGADAAREVLYDVTCVGPTGAPLSPPPIASGSASSRHASASGAAAVVKVWAERQSAYLQLLRAGKALTDHEAAALLDWQLCSVNSVRNSIDRARRRQGKPALITFDGYDLHELKDVEGRVLEVTKRKRWTLVQAAA